MSDESIQKIFNNSMKFSQLANSTSREIKNEERHPTQVHQISQVRPQNIKNPTLQFYKSDYSGFQWSQSLNNCKANS